MRTLTLAAIAMLIAAPAMAQYRTHTYDDPAPRYQYRYQIPSVLDYAQPRQHNCSWIRNWDGAYVQTCD